ncbi:unnamed protein product [Rhizophagus irregularis]|nr:unnamed protein product [Rhizophagus irregularis]
MNSGAPKEVPKELPPPPPGTPKEVPKELPPPAPGAPKDAPKAAPKSGPLPAPKAPKGPTSDAPKGVVTTAALPAKSSVTGTNNSPSASPVDQLNPSNIMAASIAGGVISNLILIFIAGSCFFLVKFYKNKKENSRAIATPGVNNENNDNISNPGITNNDLYNKLLPTPTEIVIS